MTTPAPNWTVFQITYTSITSAGICLNPTKVCHQVTLLNRCSSATNSFQSSMSQIDICPLSFLLCSLLLIFQSSLPLASPFDRTCREPCHDKRITAQDHEFLVISYVQLISLLSPVLLCILLVSIQEFYIYLSTPECRRGRLICPCE